MDYPLTVPGIGLIGGKFSDEMVNPGQTPSVDPAAWANAVTDEILNVLSAANINPDEDQLDQLLQGINFITAEAVSAEAQVTAQAINAESQARAQADAALANSKLVSVTAGLQWGAVQITGWVNAYDADVNWTAPIGSVVVGERSLHLNSAEDRQFRFRYRSVAVAVFTSTS